MLIITVEGGLVQNISTDNATLKKMLEKEWIVVLDYDTEGASLDETLTIPQADFPDNPSEAFCHMEEIVDVAPEIVEAIEKGLDL